jgi:hypothetical protein
MQQQRETEVEFKQFMNTRSCGKKQPTPAFFQACQPTVNPAAIKNYTART